jgi:hypothetical protein
MRSQRRTSVIVVGGALAIASGAYGLGTQADDGTAIAENSQNGQRGERLLFARGAPCGFSDLADKLGVDENKLEQALSDFRSEDEGGVRVDFAKDLAAALGISRDKVTAALDKLHTRREQRFERRVAPSDMPPPPGRMSFHFGMPPRQLASDLGVTTSELRDALREVRKQADDWFEQHNRALAEFLADRFDLDVDEVSDALAEPGPPLPSLHRGGLPDHPPAP